MTSETGNRQKVSVGGHRITLTNVDKVLYPETGATKADVLDYYAQIAPYLIAHAAGRPATRKRWVDGVGTAKKPGKAFFNKDLGGNAPSWIKHYAIEHTDHTNDYPLINDLATLTWFAQLAALEIHVPQWQFGRGGRQQNPDRLVLDLDPGDGAGLHECAEVAKLARKLLRDMGLTSVPVTSGSKGIHLYAALDGSQSSEEVTEVAHELARAMAADEPDLIVSDMKKSLRRGKVLVDWSQNNGSKTTVAPYSLRGRSRPTVAVPRTWREVGAADLGQLEMADVVSRMKRRKDPLAVLADASGKAIDLADTEGSSDRLDTYRSKRDKSKTSEPVPAGRSRDGDGQSFVIHEHDARQLHYDFRLERGGVLVSWALPKGVPDDPKRNRLAVQTEDHPLEYGSFEGTIPKGEYGAGTVTIWDAGEYEAEKWRNDEVVVTLHGRRGGGLGGPAKFALIHTGGEGKDDAHWLIHLMEGGRDREPLAPMLATLGDGRDLGTGDEWAYEMKWDGLRAIAYVGGGETRLLSRAGNDITASFPDIAEELAAAIGADSSGGVGSAVGVPDSAVLDGEIVALNGESRPDFGLLQQRMGLTKKREVSEARKKTPVHFMVFDVLEVGGESLRQRRYDERRKALDELIASPGRGRIQVPPAFDGNFDEAMASSSSLGLEGVVAKRQNSTYAAGRRSRAWIKVKHQRMQEVVIGGWRPGNGSRKKGIGSLLVGVHGEDGLEYIGRVGTGFTDQELESLGARLAKIERKTSPFSGLPTGDARNAHWVTPKLVGEVHFAEWTRSGRLRQASWRGLRADKSAKAVAR